MKFKVLIHVVPNVWMSIQGLINVHWCIALQPKWLSCAFARLDNLEKKQVHIDQSSRHVRQTIWSIFTQQPQINHTALVQWCSGEIRAAGCILITSKFFHPRYLKWNCDSSAEFALTIHVKQEVERHVWVNHRLVIPPALPFTSVVSKSISTKRMPCLASKWRFVFRLAAYIYVHMPRCVSSVISLGYRGVDSPPHPVPFLSIHGSQWSDKWNFSARQHLASQA